MEYRRILLVEPQCHGFEHVPVNAAFAEVCKVAFPTSSMVFMGESQHIGGVRNKLTESCRRLSDSIEWKAISIPQRRSSAWRRLPAELALTRNVFTMAREWGADLVILLSITAPGLIAAKCMLSGRASDYRVIAVPHQILNTLLHPPRRPWERVLDMNVAMSLYHPRQLTYIALGPSIMNVLCRERPQHVHHFMTLDHPYLWSVCAMGEDDYARVEGSDVTFVYFGVGNRKKIIEKYIGLASEVRKVCKSARYDVAGFCTDPVEKDEAKVLVNTLARVPLSPSEYDRRGRYATYAVWIGDASVYRLTASASFLDALSYIKPGICMDSPFVRHYYETMGDIGYLCGDLTEMKEVMIAVAQNFPVERYRRQCSNILVGRKIFDPESVARELRAAMGGG